MRRIPWYVIVIVIFLGLYSFALYKKPVKTNWKPTLINKDKIPYGGYVLFNELDTLLGYKPHPLRVSPYEFCSDSTTIGSGELYMFVSPSLKFSEADVNALLDYVSMGNDVFISSESIGDEMEDTLKVSISRNFTLDSVTTGLVNPSLDNKRMYGMRKQTINVYIKKFDTARTVVLGMNSKKDVNYVMMKWGEGRIFLNTVPAMYTNFSILDANNIDYVSRSLSYLDYDPDGFYWDEYFKQGRVGATSPLRVILERPPLKAAMYTALAAILLFMIFQSKRRQRIIPVITPPENSTVDFVETVSQVYLNKSNHRNIAMKQVTYLFEYIRTRYQLDTSMPDDAFAKKLAHKAGYPEKDAIQLMELIRFVRSEEGISDQHLLKLNRLIQEFHKQTDK